MQIPALGAVKLSFIFFFRRIFVTGVGRVFRSVTTIIIVIITAWVVALFVALLVACRGDFAAWWVSVDDLNTKCIDTLELENAFAISDFILDLIVIILPIPQVCHLRPRNHSNSLNVHIDLEAPYDSESEIRSNRNFLSWSSVSAYRMNH